MFKFNKYLILLLSVLIFISCDQDEKIKIALSKASGSESYKNYIEWLDRYDNDSIEYIDLYNKSPEEVEKILKNVSGIVLTGGPDVHPGRYGKAYDTARCTIDAPRDTIEFLAINYAMEHKVPIIGVCRGLQIMNVALGGSLIVDIPEDYDTTVVHQVKGEPDNPYHEIDIDTTSLLGKLAGRPESMVNSNHHQGIDILAPGLRATARTRDSLIESIEWIDTTRKPFIYAVQWHPERLKKGDPLSEPLARRFLAEVYNYHNKENQAK